MTEVGAYPNAAAAVDAALYADSVSFLPTTRRVNVSTQKQHLEQIRRKACFAESDIVDEINLRVGKSDRLSCSQVCVGQKDP